MLSRKVLGGSTRCFLALMDNEKLDDWQIGFAKSFSRKVLDYGSQRITPKMRDMAHKILKERK